MDRRRFLRTMSAGAGAGLLNIALSRAIRAGSSGRPNIIYIFTDQQYTGAMSCAGNPNLSTPAMDSLAESGVRFEETYCAYPLCSPSRAAMFTGVMPHQAGVYDNGFPISDEYKPRSLGRILSGAGYDCVYGGKWHLPGISVQESDESGFRRITGFSDRELAGACVNFLKERHDKPFFMAASFDNPHNICEWSRSQPLPWGPVPEAPVEDCPNLPPNFAVPAYEPEAIREVQKANPRLFLGARYSEDRWRQYRYAYYRLIEKVDAEIDRILNALREERLEENTLVLFSSDHGDGHGAHRWNQKWVLYEESVRVPLIASFGGRGARGITEREHLVSNGLDIFPTVCDFAGAESPEGLHGRSLRPFIEGRPPENWRDYLVTEMQFGPEINGLNTDGRMVRTKRYKYCVYSWGKNREQLFDMEKDPGEMVNLAVESRYNDILNRHRALLGEWMRKTKDRFVRYHRKPE